MLTCEIIARKYCLTGLVQGVGFRPHIYRQAKKLNLTGWVLNNQGTVIVQAQGSAETLAQFESSIIENAPPISDPLLDKIDIVSVDSALSGFSILRSESSNDACIHIPGDLFVCEDCLRELYNPSDRRYRYPFINCTQCGPRYSLIKAMPYDRVNTTMAGFPLCADCLQEYENPLDRRFHAEPVACPVCGPALEFKRGNIVLSDNSTALSAAVTALQAGKILAVKGVGGYHLMCDARNSDAISRLRSRKPRPDKPLAVMFPSPVDAPLSVVEHYVNLDDRQRCALLGADRPILLADMHEDSDLSLKVAPGLNELGVFLPYSPLHHLLLNDFSTPLIATSANISDEPVLTDAAEVERKLAKVADGFLHHNRPIQRPIDDPVFRLINDELKPLRAGRGTSPLELELPFTLQQPVVCVGGHTKNTITLGWENRAVVSAHIGDLDTYASKRRFDDTIEELQQLYGVTAEIVVHDAHSGYSSSRWARESGLPAHAILHHHAHASSIAEFDNAESSQLVFTWDGVGLGEEGILWGGEAFLGGAGKWTRVASFRPYSIPGGDKAGREPWRSAIALAWESGFPISPSQLGQSDHTEELLRYAWNNGINCPKTSAVGRLFDAAAALSGLCTSASFEGQGPMLLEAVSESAEGLVLPMTVDRSGVLITDWSPLLSVVSDHSIPVSQRAGVFHESMAQALLQQAKQVRNNVAVVIKIGLSGGVFQNRKLTERCTNLLQGNGFTVISSSRVPVNDGGLSYGQLVEFAGLNCVIQAP